MAAFSKVQWMLIEEEKNIDTSNLTESNFKEFYNMYSGVVKSENSENRSTRAVIEYKVEFKEKLEDRRICEFILYIEDEAGNGTTV